MIHRVYAYRQAKGDRLSYDLNTLISQYGYAALVIGSLAKVKL